MEERTAEQLSKRKILSYTAKKRTVVATVAVVLSIVALCFVNLNSAIPLISIPIIAAAAFVVDKILILIRPDVYGKDMLRRGRTPIIAICTVVAVFTAICLLSGIVAFQLTFYAAKNANVVQRFDTVDEAVEFIQDTSLKEKYVISVGDIPVEEKFNVYVTFTAKNGTASIADFNSYEDATLIDASTVSVKVKSYSEKLNGEEVYYYVLNEKCQSGGKIITVNNEVCVINNSHIFGAVLGAALGAVAQIAILIVVYIVGIIAAIVPSEIYFEKLVRNEARAAEKAAEEQQE